MDLASLSTKKNIESNQFQLDLGDHKALIDFKVGKSGAMYLVHTEVPPELSGQGVGHKLVRETLEIIEKEGLKITPLCPFVRSFIKEHLDDYRELLAEGTKL